MVAVRPLILKKLRIQSCMKLKLTWEMLMRLSAVLEILLLRNLNLMVFKSLLAMQR